MDGKYYNYVEEEPFALVREFFKSEKKAARWFATVNPLLGNVRPMDMLFGARRKKLLQFIKSQLDGNYA